MKNKKLTTAIMASALSVGIAFSSVALSGCNTTQNVTYDNGWIISAGAPTATTDATDGSMYLDSSSYDIYFKSNGAWEKIGNIKGEAGATGETGAPGTPGEPGAPGEPGKTPSVTINEEGYWVIDGEATSVKAKGDKGDKGDSSTVYINEDGYWVINGEVTAYKAGTVTSDQQTPQEEYLSEEEYRSQPVFFGSCHLVTSNKRIRIGFAVKMQKGATVKFIGDSTKYKFGVAEMSYVGSKDAEGHFLDSGWISGTDTYTLTEDCYPLPTIAKLDDSAFSVDDLLNLHSMFKVEGVKVSPTTTNDEGAISEEEFNAQPAHWGSLPMPTADTRLRITTAFKVKSGAKISFTGDTSIYRWTVCEVPHSAVNGLDLGWNTGWANPGDDYVTAVDGAYLVFNLSRINNGKMTASDILNMHSMFKIEGEKCFSVDPVEQKQYNVNAINHRGYSVLAPENTLSAYRMSAQRGFTKVECDIQFTSDEIPVLLHDGTIDRTSNGSGNIANLTLAEAREYDYGSWKAPEFKGEQIPTFDEFMALCRSLNLHPYIELKAALSENRAKALVNIVKKYGMIDNVTWISFGKDSLLRIVEVDDTARVGYTVGDVNATIISGAKELITGKNQVFINTNFATIGDDDVKLCMDAGIPLEAYTVNSAYAIKNTNPYVSGFTSDWAIAGEILKSSNK